jgi:tripartite ATP-independent transporter DctM subunit
MYEGAFVPGIALAGLYAVFTFITTVVFPRATPGLPEAAVGFKEAPASPICRLLTRANAVPLILGCVLVIAWAARTDYQLLPTLRSANVAALGDFFILLVNALLIAVLLFFLVKFARLFVSGNDERGLLSLFVLTVVSALFGVYMMRNSAAHGADLVVLSMFYGIMFAFAVAIVNWLTSRFLGFRFLSHMAQQTTFVMVPPLFLIFLVLGTIFIGVATPTEGGAMGASGALILGALKRRLTWDLVRQAVESTAKLASFVVFILLGARVFSLTFYGVSGHIWVESMLTSLPGGQIGFLLFVNAFVFVLAFFLDFFELAFIVIPLLGPAAEHLGIDLIWFGVILGVNMQTSFMHPPFGFALFYLRSVAPREPFLDRVTGKLTQGVTTGQIYWGAVPFVLIQLIMVISVIMFPSMVTHYRTGVTHVDPNKVKIEVPQLDLPPLDLNQSPTFK